MPKQSRNEEEVNEVRDNILSRALQIITDEGYSGLTMRKLGASLGCAAKTIYNYYGSKDEIYLRIRMDGFEKLNNMAHDALAGESDPLARLRILGNTYVHFGLAYSHYYNIMFSWDVPKYTSYVGTSFEQLASREREIALHYTVLAEMEITDILTQNGVCSRDEMTFHVARMWSVLHGYISLHHSMSFREYSVDTLAFQERIIDEMLAVFMK